MPRTMTRERCAQIVRALPAEIILKAASRCDGHTIFKPEAFLDVGLPRDVVEHVTRKYTSDGSPKGTIYVEGKAVDQLSGVYGLDLLRFLASALGVEYRSALGRGFEAQNIQAALRQHLVAADAPKPA
jgi:hypothetical protein